jgi:hypothetical protein
VKTSNVQDHFDDDEFPSPACFRGFILPDWGSGSVQALPNTCDDTSHHHNWYVECCDLHDRSDDHDGCTDEDRFLPSEKVTQKFNQPPLTQTMSHIENSK